LQQIFERILDTQPVVVATYYVAYPMMFRPTLGVGLVINRSRVRLPAVHCLVSMLRWVTARLWAGKSSRYVTKSLRSTQPSILPG